MQKYLCDQMCANLGKWLRIAGYDTAIITLPLKDREIYQMAKKEDRKIITKDRHFVEIDPTMESIIYLRGDSLDEWAEELRQKEGIDWLFAPFSRCLQCNTKLTKEDKNTHISKEIPKDVKQFWVCPHCHQVFWLGSHTQKMHKQLQSWQRG